MKALIDADVLRYEIAWGAETGWKAIVGDEEASPPFTYVCDLLSDRINGILSTTEAISHQLFITEGRTFRFDLAKKKPYKGLRKQEKPYHYNNLTVYLRDVLGATVVTGIEADDAMAIEHTAHSSQDLEPTIVCSRDKDMRQLSGWSFSWELGKQASYGPVYITKEGSLSLDTQKNKLTGSGLSFFYAQVLMGDAVDNIPGCPGVGPVATYQLLNNKSPEAQLATVKNEYQKVYGNNYEQELLEQGQLCWLVRRMTTENQPQLWQIGMTE